MARHDLTARFSWTIVIRFGSDWLAFFQMIMIVYQNFAFSFFSERKYSFFSSYCCSMNISEDFFFFFFFFLKILIREENFRQIFSFFLSANIKIPIAKEYNHLFYIMLSAVNNMWYQNHSVTFWSKGLHVLPEVFV